MSHRVKNITSISHQENVLLLGGSRQTRSIMALSANISALGVTVAPGERSSPS